MNIHKFLIVIRWQNVLIIWLVQIAVYFRYVLPYCGKNQYSFLSFLLFLLCTGIVLGAGNMYNDIQDIEADSRHPDKPKLVGNDIPFDLTYRYYYALQIALAVAVSIGFFVWGWSVLLVSVFLLASFCLYGYSTWFKSTVLAGNFLIALLCGIAVWITTLLDTGCNLMTHVDTANRIPLILYGYLFNATGITMIREMIKDKEDEKWDIEAGIHTVASLPDRVFIRIVNVGLGCCFLFNVWWFVYLRNVLSSSDWYLGLFMIFIPLILIALIFNLPHRPGVYRYLSKLIKIYILFAIMLLVLWQRG